MEKYFINKLKKRSLDNYNLNIDLNEYNINPTFSYFLYGQAGNGKTTLALQIAKQFFKLINNSSVTFIKLFDLIEESKKAQQFGEDGYQYRKNIEWYKTVPLLILDDFGTEKHTEFVEATIYDIIDARYENCLQTVITSNYSISDIKQTYHARIGDRIQEMCYCIHLTDESYRATSNKKNITTTI